MQQVMDKDTEIETDKVIHAIKKWQPHKMRNAKTKTERNKLEKKTYTQTLQTLQQRVG